MVSQTLSPNSTYVEKLEKFVGNNLFFCNMVELVNRETNLSTLCHGDCWTNNFLYKYDGNNDILETCLVDNNVVKVNVLLWPDPTLHGEIEPTLNKSVGAPFSLFMDHFRGNENASTRLVTGNSAEPFWRTVGSGCSTT